MYILKGAPETIMHDGIDYFSIAHPVARTSLQQQVGGVAHALHAACYKGLVVASADRLGGKHNGFQAGSTDLVDGKGGQIMWHGSIECGVGCRRFSDTAGG